MLSEAALKKQSEANTKVPDKQVKRVMDAGLELASRGADPETQQLDKTVLRKAEERFTIVIEELAPSFTGGYTARANVRVALGDYAAAVDDYTAALKLAPVGPDAWMTKLNRGSTLMQLGKSAEALTDLERAVEMSKRDYLTLLGRGSALHTTGNYAGAAVDYAAVLDKNPTDIQPFWLRLALEYFQLGRKVEAVGLARRVANKFDLEPEAAIAVSSMLWADGIEADQTEALRRWKVLPEPVRAKALVFDLAAREWPPAAVDAAAAFRREVQG